MEIVRAMFEPFNGVDIAGIDWGGEAMRENRTQVLAGGRADHDGIGHRHRP